MRILVALSALALAAASSALTYDDISNWTGTGANRAALVIDWNDGQGPESFVWGFRWDGAATGEDMLGAIVAADPLLTWDVAHYSFGDAVNGLGYGSHLQSGFGSSYWGYYTAESGSTSPASWTSSFVGMGDRTLSNGSWDGWSFGTYPNETAPSTPIAAPVPEPASFAVLALGALAVRRRRRA